MLYAEGVTKTNIGLMNANKEDTSKVTLCNQEKSLGTSHSTQYKTWCNHFLPALE